MALLKRLPGEWLPQWDTEDSDGPRQVWHRWGWTRVYLESPARVCAYVSDPEDDDEVELRVQVGEQEYVTEMSYGDSDKDDVQRWMNEQAAQILLVLEANGVAVPWKETSTC